MIKTMGTPYMKLKARLSKRGMRALNIGIIIALIVVVAPIIFIIVNLNTQLDTDRLEARLAQIEGVASVDATYGHSGAPWNNNVWITIQPDTDDPLMLAEIVKDSRDPIIESAAGIAYVTTTFQFVDQAADQPDADSAIDPRRVSAACAILFAPSDEVTCGQTLVLSKDEVASLL
jgi:hypothetical protein